MATVRNLRLEIGDERDGRHPVTVTYELCFTSCEVVAGATYHERVSLRGDDPIWDDHLIWLRSGCVRASEGCIERRIAVNVTRNRLDEDPDTVIFGWVIGDVDEVYAQVALDPFTLHSTSSRSNTVSRHFGPAGN